MANVRLKKAFRGNIRAHVTTVYDNIQRMITYNANHNGLNPPLLIPADITTLNEASAICLNILNEVKN